MNAEQAGGERSGGALVRYRARVVRATSVDTLEVIDDARIDVDPAGRVESLRAWADGDSVDDVEDLRPGVVTPGFVDTHLHFPQTRVIGSASGPLLTWLQRSVFPEEARFSDTEHARTVARAYVDRMMAAGTTLSLSYGSVHPAACDALFAEADRAGVRMIAGPVLMETDCPEALQLPWSRARDGLERLRERWHDPAGRLQLAVVPRFALSCTEGTLRAAAEYAEGHGLVVTTHIAETEAEYAATCERFGATTYLDVYARNGLVHDRTVLAHCIYLREAEWDAVAAAGTIVAHCPDSNDFLGSGSMPIRCALDRGIPLTIGTDVAAGRTFSIPRTLAAAYDNGLRVGHRAPLAALLWWGTAGGASAVGRPGLGTLDVGTPADFVVHDVAAWVRTEDALAAILFDGDRTRVRSTYVDGRLVWPRAR